MAQVGHEPPHSLRSGPPTVGLSLLQNVAFDVSDGLGIFRAKLLEGLFGGRLLGRAGRICVDAGKKILDDRNVVGAASRSDAVVHADDARLRAPILPTREA